MHRISVKVIKFYLFLLCTSCVSCQFLLLVDEYSQEWSKSFQDGLADFQDSFGTSFDYKAVEYKNESNWPEVCQYISNGVSVVLDLTKRIGDPETQAQKFFTSKIIPYFKVDMPYDALLRSVDSILKSTNGSNGFLLFSSDHGVNRGVNTILGTTIIRYAFLEYPAQEMLIQEKFQYRVPSAVAIIGTQSQIREFTLKQKDLVRNRTEWIFIFNEFIDSSSPPRLDTVKFPYFKGYFPVDLCCSIINIRNDMGASDGRGCSASSCQLSPSQLFLRRLAYILSQVKKEVDSSRQNSVKLNCNDGKSGAEGNKEFSTRFTSALNTKAGAKLLTAKNGRIIFSAPVILEDFVNGTGNPVGEYTFEKGLVLNPKFVFRTRRRYFRIGIVESTPWTMWNKDSKEWTGYCIDLAVGLARKMDFDYDLIESKEFGKRVPPHGRWDGLTGDLIHGV